MLWSLLIISLIGEGKHGCQKIAAAHSCNFCDMQTANGATTQLSICTSEQIPPFDGNKDNCAHTLEEQNSRWRVDLRGVYSISCISIKNKDQDNNNLTGAQIHIGNSRDINRTANSTFKNITNKWNKFTFPEDVSGRYVTVFFPGNKSLPLCEMWIYGTRKESPFMLIKQTRTWENALYHCRDNDMDLASILGEEDQAWAEVEASKANTSFVWLGLHYTCTLEFWFWVDDHSVEFSHWGPNATEGDCDMSGAMQKNEDHLWVRKNVIEKFNFLCTKQKKSP